AVLTWTILLSGCWVGDDDPSTGSGQADDDELDDDLADDDLADDDLADDDADDDAVDDDAGDDDTEIPPDPFEPGPYGFAFTNATFFDPSSNANQPIRVYYPTTDGGVSVDGGDGPRAVVIFGPGFSAPMSLYFSYGEHLATHGFIVIFRNSYVIAHQALSATTSALIDWAEAEAQDSGSLFFEKIDPSRIGTSGHSMGGKIAFLTAHDDPRVTAAGTVDPVDTSPLPGPAYPSVTPELMPAITIPTLMIGGSDGGPCAPANDNYHEYFTYANAPAVEIRIEQSGHVVFCDLPDAIIDLAGIICPTGGAEDYEFVRALSRRYLTAFFKSRLDGEAAYDHYLTGDGIMDDVNAGLVAVDVKD
ncbi:MAG: hypothetical protein KJ042_12435, partial [Deltaproteobacteria bacterium]|nr:hypothetical protein [Deltaproteobacteria bacterium]